jgi:hypothetical protein
MPLVYARDSHTTRTMLWSYWGPVLRRLRELVLMGMRHTLVLENMAIHAAPEPLIGRSSTALSQAA